MRILILGGTAWLGREITRTAIDAGHEVTCLARRTDVEPGAAAIGADRDQPNAYQAVSTETWDAVVDLASQPGHVRSATRALGARTQRYVLVSTVSVYADAATVGQDEEATLLPPLEADEFDEPSDYGRAKVACEHALGQTIPADRTLIVRPGLIGGPGDPTGRSTYWPWRFRNPAVADGTVVIPDAPTQPTALIDVRDLAAFIVNALAAGLTGTFNAMGDPLPLSSHLAAARDVAGHTGPLLAAEPAWLAEHNVQCWSGPRSLPMWIDSADALAIHTHQGDRAIAAGLMLRPLTATLEDALIDRAHTPGSYPAGLSDADERELFAAAFG